MSRATTAVFARHVWYRSERLAGVALFDDHLTLEVKKRTVTAIELVKGSEQPTKWIVIDIPAKDLEQKIGADFCTTPSNLLFEQLAIGMYFLVLDPATWSRSTCYVEGKRRIMALCVIVDRSERGIALMQRFNLAFTNDDEQRQYLLQVVERHRKEQPSTSSAYT